MKHLFHKSWPSGLFAAGAHQVGFALILSLAAEPLSPQLARLADMPSGST